MYEHRWKALLGCSVLAASLGAPLGHAQTTTGSITGQVSDPSGAVVANATVTATNVDTGVSTPVKSNASGVFTVRFLPIGRYTLTVAASGFGQKITAPFSLEINQTIKINTTLTLGSESTSVSVHDTAPILNSSDGVISTTFTNNEIQNFPLEGRNFQSVTLYTPGVVQTDPTGMTGQNAIERSTTSNNLISVNGNRGQANYDTLDGVNINETQNNQVSYNPAPDSLDEIKVISGNAPAIYGNVNGGDVVSVLKSGTNHFHGTAYAYLQNDKLNANSWSNKDQTPIEPRNRYTQTTFGGTIGGPILRNKLFAFGDYEGVREPEASTSTYQVLTPAMLGGDFSAYPFQLYNTQAYDPATNTYPAYVNNQIPVNNPVAKYLAAHPQDYPAPNAAPETGTYIPTFQGKSHGAIVNNQFDVKVDYAPEIRDRISGFYSQSRAHDGSTTAFPISFPGVNSYPTTLFGASWVHTFSAAIVNQANAGYARTNWNNGVPIDYFGTFGYTGDQQVGIPFGVQRYVGFTAMNISGASTIGNQGAPQLLIDNQFDYSDNLTIQKGTQLFTIGVQANRYQEDYTQSQNAGALGNFGYNGEFTNNPNISGNPNFGPADFVLDAADSANLLDGGEFGNRQWRAAGYIEDDWKILPALTLNLGLRYEYDEPMVEANNKTANVLPLNFGTLEYAKAVPAGAPAGSIVCPTTACYNPNYKQIMPRFGFAYQVRSTMTVRGGYGASSFFEGNAANQRLTDNPPLVSAFQLTAGTPGAGTGGSALHASQGFPVSTNVLQPTGGQYGQWPQNIQPAYVQEYNLTIEQQVNAHTSLTMSYVGQSGQHLMDYGNVNQFTQAQIEDINVNKPAVLPASDLTPYYKLAGNGGGVLVTESRAKSNYNGLQVSLVGRQYQGLQYNLNYTWAKSMTNAAGNYGVPNVTQGLTFENYYNSQADYGVSGDDIRSQFNAVIVYALPYGHGRQFGGSANAVLDEVLGGWTISNAFKAYTGVPVTITANGGDTNSYGTTRANQYAPLAIINRSHAHWFGTSPAATPCTDDSGVQSNGCAYGQPSTYEFGTAANGTERAPGFYNLDTSLFKDVHVFRAQTVGFRSDFFNILNVADYGNPDGNIQDSTFGLVNSVRNQERRIQLSLNYKF
jgi:hypothetical protein